MEKDINKVQFGATRETLSQSQPRWCADWNFDPAWDDGNPPETADGTTMWQNPPNRGFKPRLRFRLNFTSASDFPECSQTLIGDPFVVRVFNPYLKPAGRWAVYQMRLTNSSVRLFARLARNIYGGVADFEIEAVSVHQYDTWQIMSNYAEPNNDPRF